VHGKLTRTAGARDEQPQQQQQQQQQQTAADSSRHACLPCEGAVYASSSLHLCICTAVLGSLLGRWLLLLSAKRAGRRAVGGLERGNEKLRN